MIIHMTAQAKMIQHVLANIDWNYKGNNSFATSRLHDCICESQHIVRINDILEETIHVALLGQYSLGAVLVCSLIFGFMQVSE